MFTLAANPSTANAPACAPGAADLPAQARIQRGQMLLATDLDGTFLAGDPADRLKLYQLITRHPDIQLAFVTGRGLEAVMPFLDDPTLPIPDYVICDVGATVVDNRNQLVSAIQGEIDAGWPGEHTVAQALAHLPGLTRQDVPQRGRCSYYCAPEAITEELRAAVEALGCELRYTKNQYLDILPRGVHKGATLRRLVDHLGIHPDTVLVAGDTEHDIGMFRQGYKSVCVGPSDDLLRQSTRHLGHLLHAQRPGCGGILEAMAHFGFLGEKAIAALAANPRRTGTSEVVLVYHRLPYEETIENGRIKRRRPQSPNGIIPTLLSFFGSGIEGSWVAWSVHDEAHGPFEVHTAVDAERYPNLTAARVALTKDQVDIFYKRFSKEAFWPVLHTFWERCSFNEDHWKVFCDVNHAFAEACANEAAENAIVWLHDYNLWMVPAYLRELRPDVRIAFFHHTYFPSGDVFNVLPWRRQIIGSLLQCDYIGFHIPRQVENFVDVVRGVAPTEVLERVSCAPRFQTYGCAVGVDQMASVIRVHERTVHLGAHPVGLDLGRIEESLRRPEPQRRMAELRESLGDMKLILSVERLDFTKGILEKLQAYERLLEQHPEWHRKVTLISICVPAAREMRVYDELQTQIEQAAGRINGRFASVGWTPLQFFFRGFPFEEVVAYYACADVMWITPLRDGLNLVALEYAATQGMTGGSGVLTLSEFTGAAAMLKDAVLTNPHDPADLTARVHQALTMDPLEAQARMRGLNDTVSYYTLQRWGDEFLAAVRQARPDGTP